MHLCRHCMAQLVRFLRNEFPAEGGHLSICLAIAQGIRYAADAGAQVINVSIGSEEPAPVLRDAVAHVGAVVGEVSPDELLGRIFAQFCIGK